MEASTLQREGHTVRHADILLIVAFGMLGAALSWWGSGGIDARLYQPPAGWDIWFEADPPRVYNDMTQFGGRHDRLTVHPAFSLVALPPTRALMKWPGVDALQAMRMVTAACAFLLAGLFFIVARRLGYRRLDSALLTLLLMSTAASLFWTCLAETFSLGSLTVLFVLLLALLAEQARIPVWLEVLGTVASGCVTVTNAMAGGALLWVRHGVRRATVLGALSIALVAGLWLVQKLMLPFAQVTLTAREAIYLFSSPPFDTLRAFFVHTAIMPHIGLRPLVDHPGWNGFSIQASAAGSASVAGPVAVILWLAVLAIGFGTLLRKREFTGFWSVASLFLAGQLALHLMYGTETFLYVLHWTPILVLIIGAGLTGPLRTAVLCALPVLIALALWNNVSELSRAQALLPALLSQP